MLCKDHKVSSITVRRAVENLAKEGLLDRVPGAGTFVKKTDKAQSDVKSDTISLVFANIYGDFPSAIITGIESIARRAGYKTQLYISDDDYSVEREHIKQILEEGTSGIIVFGVCHSQANPNCDIFLDVKNKGIPLILVDTFLPSLDIDHVVCADYEGSYSIADHFIKSGCREIGYISTPEKVTSIEARLAGFQKAMADNDLLVRSKHVIYVEDYPDHQDFVARNYKSLSKSIKSLNGKLPDAFLCCNDSLAFALYRVLLENGVNVPEQVAIGGFGGGSLADMSLFPITTVLQPKRELGEKAVELLLQRVAGPDQDSGRRHISIPTQLVVGGNFGFGE